MPKDRAAAFAAAVPSCPQCEKPLPLTSTAGNQQVRPGCGHAFEGTFFSPRGDRAASAAADAALVEAPPCVSHARNAAEAICERCGAFICAVCRIEIEGRTLCPACFERLQSEGSLAAVKTRFRDFAGLARITALLGLVFAIFAVAIGPLAVFYAVKALEQKREMAEADGKAGIRVALAAGVLETVLGLVLVAVWIASLRA
jgi:hypothetical protein